MENLKEFYSKYKNNIKKICGAYHQESLSDCISTEKNITNIELETIYNEYTYYAYDERIKAHRFILHLHSQYNFLPTWIHIYMK